MAIIFTWLKKYIYPFNKTSNYVPDSHLKNSKDEIKKEKQNDSKPNRFYYTPKSTNGNKNVNETKEKVENQLKPDKFNYRQDLTTTITINNEIKNKTQDKSKSEKINNNQVPKDQEFVHLPVSPMTYNRKDFIFVTFDPKENLYYFFFSERNQPKLDTINGNDLGHFGLYDALDIQRYRYYPGTTNIFTFVGFSNPRQREEAKL
ncbi:hypothetical protein M9Y10_011015 [Tritrichomonas musculus]|uniref:Uncharacterized protein n=1 Tax=Tritrichomonas musculus TaxID=1915356 RepID=A0ABR2IMG9_9EUKA